jgi:hypothetical protein
MTFARKHNFEDDKIYLLNSIAVDLAEAGEIEWSNSLFEKTIKYIKSLPSDTINLDKKNAIVEIIKGGHYKEGIDLAYSFDSDDWSSGLLLEKSANEISKMNNDSKTDQFFKTAVEKAFEHGNTIQNSNLFWEFGKILTKMKKDELADLLFQKSIDLYIDLPNSEKLTDEEMKSRCEDLLQLGRQEWASEIANTIVDENLRNHAMFDIACAVEGLDEVDKSLKYFELFPADDPKDKFYTLRCLAEKLIKKEDYTGFEKLFPALLQSAVESYTDDSEKTDFFYYISDFLMDLPCSEQQKYIQEFMAAYDEQ